MQQWRAGNSSYKNMCCICCIWMSGGRCCRLTGLLCSHRGNPPESTSLENTLTSRIACLSLLYCLFWVRLIKGPWTHTGLWAFMCFSYKDSNESNSQRYCVNAVFFKVHKSSEVHIWRKKNCHSSKEWQLETSWDVQYCDDYSIIFMFCSRSSSLEVGAKGWTSAAHPHQDVCWFLLNSQTVLTVGSAVHTQAWSRHDTL